MSQRAWTIAKAVLIVLAVADIAFGIRFSNVPTIARPLSPQGAFVLPFATHGGTTYISQIDQTQHRIAFFGGFVIVVLYQITRRLSAKHSSGPSLTT